MTWRLRPAGPADLDRLAALLGKLFAIETDFQIAVALQKRGLRLLLESPRSCILVAEADEKVIGMVTGQLTISTAEGGQALLVEDLVIDEHWRGRGIGRRLLAGIGEWAAAHGARRLQLLADRNNAAGLDFYGKLGWRTTELICLRTYTA